MTKLIDLEEIQRVLDARKARIGDAVLGDTEAAALARHEIEVASAMTIWRTKEINRGTHSHHLINAILVGTAASLGSELLQRVPADVRAQAAVSMCRELCVHLLQIIEHSAEERADYSTIISQRDVGTA